MVRGEDFFLRFLLSVVGIRIVGAGCVGRSSVNFVE